MQNSASFVMDKQYKDQEQTIRERTVLADSSQYQLLDWVLHSSVLKHKYNSSGLSKLSFK